MKWRLKYKLENYINWFYIVIESSSVMMAKRKLISEKPMAYNIIKMN